MNSPILQLLVLAGIAIFLILRLKSVLGTRDGFEGPPKTSPVEKTANRRGFEVIEGGRITISSITSPRGPMPPPRWPR